MEWICLFEAATRDLDSDAPRLRRILDEIKHAARCSGDGYRLDSEAKFAMGWWFFAIHVQEEFVKGAVGYMHAIDPKARDERALLEHIQKRLKEQNSGVTLKLHGNRSIFTKYWTWLMR